MLTVVERVAMKARHMSSDKSAIIFMYGLVPYRLKVEVRNVEESFSRIRPWRPISVFPVRYEHHNAHKK
jgi:hypothetical protein